MRLFLLSLDDFKSFGERPEGWVRKAKRTALLLGVLGVSAVPATSLAEALNQYNVDVGSFTNGIPNVGKKVALYDNEIAPTDSLIIYTGLDGHAVHSGVSAVGDVPFIPKSLSFGGANPSSGISHIIWGVSAEKSVLQNTLELYDLDGARISTLHSGENTFDKYLSAGMYIVHDKLTGDSMKITSLSPLTKVIVDQERVHIEKSQNKSLNPTQADIVVEGEGETQTLEDVTLQPPAAVNEFMVDFGADVKILSGDAWNLVGDSPLIGGMAYVKNASGETFSAPVDSNFTVNYTIASPSEDLKIWFEHPLMSKSGVLIDQDGLAVRDRIAQVQPATMDVDTMTVNADNMYLTGDVRYKAVDVAWINNSDWQGLLAGTQVTRGEDRPEEDGHWRLEGLLNEYDQSTGTFLGSISSGDADRIDLLINYKADLLNGGQADGTQYANVTSEMTATPAGGTDVGYLFIDSTQGPSNSVYTEGGFLEIHFASTPPTNSALPGEFFGEELKDVDDSLDVALDGNQLTEVGLAAFNTHYLFDDGAIFSINNKINDFREPSYEKIIFDELMNEFSIKN